MVVSLSSKILTMMDQDDPVTQPEPFRAPVSFYLPLILPPPPVFGGLPPPPVFGGPRQIWFPPLLGPEGEPGELPSFAWRDPRKRRNTPPSPPPRPASWLSWARGDS